MVDIPNYLRQPIRRSFAEAAVQVWRTNPTETGPAIRAKLYDKAPSRFNVTWNLDALEWAAFDGWFRYDIDQGTTVFTVPLLTSFDLVDHECFFVKNPSYKQRGKRVVISAQLEARFKQFDTEANFDDLNDTLQGMFDAGDLRPSQTLSEFSNFMRQTLPDSWINF